MSEKSVPLSRREFLSGAGVLAGSAVVCGALPAAGDETRKPAGELPRHILGKTGVSVTALTLGTAPVGFAKPASPRAVADCVNAAIDLGITAIDTAPAYDIAEEGVGLGLGSRRKDVFLSTKVLADTIADAEKSFSRSLRRLKTDFVDLVYFHQLGDHKPDEARGPEGVYTWLLRQKKAGKTRFVGVSGHNRPGCFPSFLEPGDVDVILVVINLVDRHTYGFEDKVVPIAPAQGGHRGHESVRRVARRQLSRPQMSSHARSQASRSGRSLHPERSRSGDRQHWRSQRRAASEKRGDGEVLPTVEQ